MGGDESSVSVTALEPGTGPDTSSRVSVTGDRVRRVGPLRSSISFSPSVSSTAATASSRCPGFDAPMIGAVTRILVQQPGESHLGARHTRSPAMRVTASTTARSPSW